MSGVEAFLLGVMGIPAGVAYWMTFRQVAAAARGHEMRRRDTWEQTLLLYNGWTGAKLTYEKVMGSKPSADVYREIKAYHGANSRRTSD